MCFWYEREEDLCYLARPPDRRGPPPPRSPPLLPTREKYSWEPLSRRPLSLETSCTEWSKEIKPKKKNKKIQRKDRSETREEAARGTSVSVVNSAAYSDWKFSWLLSFLLSLCPLRLSAIIVNADRGERGKTGRLGCLRVKKLSFCNFRISKSARSSDQDFTSSFDL